MLLSEALPVNATSPSKGEMVELLTSFLEEKGRPPHTMNFHQLDGYVRALAGGPLRELPADWMGLIFNDEPANYKSAEEATTITNVLICLYTWHREQVLSNRCDLPFELTYPASREHCLDAEQWARGFLQGYIVLYDIWEQFLAEDQTSSKLAVILPESAHDEIDAILAAVSCVADAEFALQSGTSAGEISENFNRLPQIIIQYGRIGHCMVKG